ncbi:MAG: anti-sigma factor [Firmicutes bacterium]|nr:anti-sigma factor [Bacillota bacterium]
MNCNDARELLSFYLDQELSASAQQELTKHLQACPACARELEELRMTTVLLASWEEKEPPPGLHQGIMSRLREAVGPTTTSKSASGLAFAVGEPPPLTKTETPLPGHQPEENQGREGRMGGASTVCQGNRRRKGRTIK